MKDKEHLFSDLY